LASKVNGYGVSVMAMFNLDAEEVVELLTEWQQRYGADSGSGAELSPNHPAQPENRG
jgi:hypothetical protein